MINNMFTHGFESVLNKNVLSVINSFSNEYLYKSIDSNNKHSYLYLIYNKNTGLHKIGISSKNNINKRLQGYICSTGCEIIVKSVYLFFAEICIKSKDAEFMAHRLFKEKRVAGEWFDLKNEDLLLFDELICQINGDDVTNFFR